jgi:biopolymer transport protein ExbB
MIKVTRFFAISFVAVSALVLGAAPQISPFATPAYAQDSEISSLNELLQAVRRGRVRDNQLWEQREQEFLSSRNRQSSLLNQAERDLASEEARADRLEAAFTENEQRITVLAEQLNERLGDFGELFGVVRQVAGDTRAQLDQSMISAEYPDRGRVMNRLTNSRQLPTVGDIEDMWFELQREMTEQGSIARFEADVVRPDTGATERRDVIRIGPFTAITADTGQFLRFESDTGRLNILPSQPASRFMGAADQLRGASAGELTVAALDPSQGAILGLLVQTPGLRERIDQGKTVGYIILVIGSLGVLLAVQRLLALFGVSGSVRSQMRKPDQPKKGNPLGRVLLAYQDNQDADVETLGLKLDDAILKELPRLEWGLNTVRVLAAVSPLLGLLGTVTGMIVVFQQITLFGTGDPKLMAGGISQALVTTVLGLVAAIPLLLLHALASGQSRGVVQVLEEQAAGIVARHAEGGRR